jgi:hypothetical protein
MPHFSVGATRPDVQGAGPGSISPAGFHPASCDDPFACVVRRYVGEKTLASVATVFMVWAASSVSAARAARASTVSGWSRCSAGNHRQVPPSKCACDSGGSGVTSKSGRSPSACQRARDLRLPLLRTLVAPVRRPAEVAHGSTCPPAEPAFCQPPASDPAAQQWPRRQLPTIATWRP